MKIRLLIGFAAFLVAVTILRPILYAEPQNFPPGFNELEVTRDLELPIDMEVLSNGDIWVAQKGSGTNENGRSELRLVRNGVVRSEPLLTLSTNVYWDSGLLGFVLDPNFDHNRYLYIWYATGKDAVLWSGETKLRLSRFKYDLESETIPLETELIMIDNYEWYNYHHGNALMFDAEGNLLLGLGDRQEYQLVQSLDNNYGKIFRIRPTETGYEIPADNPFIGVPGVIPEIYAYGVRNPFRMAKREGDETIVLADVGSLAWEEVNLLEAGSNYGWSVREGPCPAFQSAPCEGAGPEFTDPIFTYPHDSDLGIGSSGAITALDFYEGTTFPEEYHNDLFFADFNQKFLAVADLNTPNEFDVFAPIPSGAVDIEYHKNGLYYLMIWGALRYIYYEGGDNQVPTAALEIENSRGAAPLTVTFSGAESSDPDDVLLTYHWDFDDGTVITSTTAMVTHTYTVDGTYHPSLTVSDQSGGVSSRVESMVSVYSGEFPTIELTIINEPTRDQWHGNDQIMYAVGRSNLDGLDNETPFTWHIDLHHNEHTHPIIASNPVISDVLALDRDNHGGDWNLWFRFYLTMKTDTGQEIVVQREIRPEFVQMTFQTAPKDIPITVNSGVYPSPHAIRTIVGVENSAAVPAEILYEQSFGKFGYWHSYPGWPRYLSNEPFFIEEREITVVAPETNIVYAAQYIYDRPAPTIFLPVINQNFIPAQPE